MLAIEFFPGVKQRMGEQLVTTGSTFRELFVNSSMLSFIVALAVNIVVSEVFDADPLRSLWFMLSIIWFYLSVIVLVICWLITWIFKKTGKQPFYIVGLALFLIGWAVG